MKRKSPHRTRHILQMEDLENRVLMAADLSGKLLKDAAVTAPTVSKAKLTDDKYEQNDTRATATSLGTLTAGTTLENLVMADSEDWFSFTTKSKGTAASAIDIRFAHTSGDLDLKLYNAKGAEVRSSTGVVNGEKISLDGLAAGTYYVQAFGKKGAFNSSYSLSIKPTVTPTINVDLQGATTSATNTGYWGNTINVESQVRNVGAGSTGAFNVQWYLSKDTLGSSDDVLLSLAGGATSYAHSGLGQNADGNQFSVSLKLPSAAPSGFSGDTFHILMKTDSGSQVTESNEQNNFGQIGTGIDRDKIIVTTPSGFFTSFDVFDASTDDSPNTAFGGGALRLNYNFFTTTSPLSYIALEAIGSGSSIVSMGTFNATANATGKLINLANFVGLPNDNYQFRLRAVLNSGATYYSSYDTLSIIDSTWIINGTYRAETSAYTGDPNTGRIYRGGGGTDTLDLLVPRSEVLSMNGYSTITGNSTANQAIYKGSAYDYLRLTNGREIYFQGIERLKFSDGTIQNLAYGANDPAFGSQWNLHVTDVPSAWRFTTGSSNVMLVSLDQGLLNAPGAMAPLGVYDINMARLITDPSDDDNFVTNGIPVDYPYGVGHGHMAISVMASTPSSTGVTGINWGSPIMVTDVYSGVTLQKAIDDAIGYARATGKKVVFQGGIQGEEWLTNSGSSLALTDTINRNADIALFAIAAGNGGPDGNITDPNYLNSVSGVAKLEAYSYNVISVGALKRTSTSIVDGLTNAFNVNIASYSNRGSNLTLMAPTDSPAVDKRGGVFDFGGTSCANPNLAAIASLVWSANPGLMGDAIRRILVETANDLGAAGDDNTFGNGLINADAAVRRAVALGRSNDLAALYNGTGFSAPATGGTEGTGGTTGGGGTTVGNTTGTYSAAPSLDSMVGMWYSNLEKHSEPTATTLSKVDITAPTSHARDLALLDWEASTSPRFSRNENLILQSSKVTHHDQLFSLFANKLETFDFI